ncbi:MAG: hypothetical protein HDR88_07810 [Bacteroides sp.]|nr:hypothetical protein [Bacteroides sp.]
MNFDSIQNTLGNFTSTIGSLVKVALMSRGTSAKSPVKEGRGLVIMGNGPSLRNTIDNDYDWLCSHDLLAVNFAANTPDFFRLRPQYYVLADGHFFSGNASDPNVARLWGEIEKISWEMTLWVPRKAIHLVKAFVLNNRNIKLKSFNLTPLEGFKGVTHFLIDAGLGMPRPRNVMIPAIMVGIREGYRKIYLCGADHTWTQTLSIDDENFVVSVQPHFYKDNDKEYERVRSAYSGLHLHDVLGSMTIAFRSYWQIADYARSKGVEIINATPGSMIDAFPRRK